jgi:hypothetical protein
LAVEDDHAVDDVPAVNASQSKDSASSLIDDLGHSQTGTAGALHNLSLLIRLTIKRNSLCGAGSTTSESLASRVASVPSKSTPIHPCNIMAFLANTTSFLDIHEPLA